MPRAPYRRVTAVFSWLLSLLCIWAGEACRRPPPTASMTCQRVDTGARGALPMLVDGELWLATVAGNRLTVAAAKDLRPTAFTYGLSDGTGEWRFLGVAVSPGGSALLLVVQPDCYSECTAKILEVLTAARSVRERWGGRLRHSPYNLEVLRSTDEPVLVGSNEWLVLRDGHLQQLCLQGGGAGVWSGLSRVGVVRTTGVTIVGPNGSSTSWNAPRGTVATSAAYAGGGHVAVVIRSRRWSTESVVILTENGTPVGRPQRLGQGHGWRATSYGEFALLSRDGRVRRLTNDRLEPEMSLGRSETLIPVPGWSRGTMVFRSSHEVCVVR